MTDYDLIHKIKNDDTEAFDVLFKRYYRVVVQYIRSISHDKYLAEDVVQQVFMTIWLNRHDLKINKSVKGYLFWVSYTTFVDQYRKSKRKSDLLTNIKEQAIRDALPEDHELLDIRIKKLKKLIETLPPVCKKVLELNKISGLKYDEIAKALNISKKTVESHMRVAFKKIREGFENDGMFFFFIRKLQEKLRLVK